MLHRTIRQCRKGTYARKRGKQRCAAFRRGHVQGGRESVSDHRARGEDGNRNVMVCTCPSGRIAAVRTHDVHDAVADIALRYTIKCYAQSGALQHDPAPADIDPLPVDELARALDGLQSWPLGLRRSVAEEMRRVECP